MIVRKRKCRLDRLKRKHRMEILKMFAAAALFMAIVAVIDLLGN